MRINFWFKAKENNTEEQTQKLKRSPLRILMTVGCVITAVLLVLSIWIPASREYRFVTVDGQKYLEFKEFEKVEIPQNNGLIIDYAESFYTLYFNSILELRLDFLFGNLDQGELFKVNNWAQWADDNGRVYIYYLDEPFVPKLPKGISIEQIKLRQDETVFELKCEDWAKSISMSAVTYDDWESISEDMDNYKLPSTATLIESYHDDGRNAMVYIYKSVYPGGMHKTVIYKINRDGKEMYVNEQYDYTYSKELPAYIYIQAKESGQIFRVFINKPANIPSVDWLASFGIRKSIW